MWFDANGPQADLKEPPSTVKQRRIATANADKLLQTLVTKKRLKGLKLDTPVALKPAKKRVTMKLLGGKEDDHHDR
ncbi:hypothetical protein [Leucobacter soli]|uniref:hypothetical protein n=1 Tax=Leucobacter soli TaxID=2812850 RepID=UPI00360B6828